MRLASFPCFSSTFSVYLVQIELRTKNFVFAHRAQKACGFNSACLLLCISVLAHRDIYFVLNSSKFYILYIFSVYPEQGGCDEWNFNKPSWLEDLRDWFMLICFISILFFKHCIVFHHLIMTYCKYPFLLESVAIYIAVFHYYTLL